MLLKFIKREKGFVAFFITILILVIMLGITMSIVVVVLGGQLMSKNLVKSVQAYYAAEAGLEDALLRLKQNPTLSPLSYNLNVGQGAGNVDISNIIGGSRVITSQGDVLNRVRKIRVVYAVETDVISFHYGAQAGEGGIAMESNSVIHGNVFSNGTVRGVTGNRSATVENTVIVAKSGNKIINLTIGSGLPDEARVHTCDNSTINGDLYYVSGGSSNCTVNGGTTRVLPNDIELANMPISNDQITNWKNEAVGGGIESGDYTVYGGTTGYLGPKKITGNLIIENNAILVLTGNLWVVGDIIINNGATIRLDTNYGSTSGVIIADGIITAENGAILEGAGVEGSYLLLLTTSNSGANDFNTPPNTYAIYVKNNSQGAIFYASNGLIRLRNNINIREATGYRLYLDNNAEITYETGLINSLFSSGPGGSWQVESWRETD